MTLQALLRQERTGLRLRLRLVLMLGHSPRRGPPRLLLSLRLGRRGGTLALLPREGCLACNLPDLGLLGVCGAGLFTQASRL
jgi:hypothetical protein